MKTFAFGVIGCGLMGREFASAAARWCHLTGLQSKPQIVATADPNAKAMEWFTDNFNITQAETDYRELLKNPQVDAVYCAIPHHLHEEVYTAVIQSGRHLFAEKPFGIDLPAAKAIIEACRIRPDVLVRCSSEFPFYPGAQRIAAMVGAGEFGEIFEVRAGFRHSSDLDPTKPINWKRTVEMNGEYGCMGDLGLHVLHLPLRLGLRPANVRAFLTNIFRDRPDGKGGSVPCRTWDNAILACESAEGVPMIFETKRVAPGETNSWYIQILGTKNSAKFSTRHPKTLKTMPFRPGSPQAWVEESLGFDGAYPSITGHIFEFGFPDAVLQMWAAYLDELNGGKPPFHCATPEEALASHRLFTAALESQESGSVVKVGDA